jgi:type I restriction enzyme M protein
MSERLNHVGLIWDIAELLRGDYKQSDYGKVILPFTVLRRLDCVLEATKDEVIEAARSLPSGASDELRDMILTGVSGMSFYTTSLFTFRTLAKDSTNLAPNLIAYVQGLSPNLRANA